MGFLSSSPVTVDGVPIQIKDNGITIGGIELVEETLSWKTREGQGSVRADDDSVSFDATVITGARKRLTYANGPAVPVNNSAAIDDIIKIYSRQKIAIAGTILDNADFTALRNVFVLHQAHWATKRRIEAKLGLDDVAATEKTALIAAYDALFAARPNVALVTPLYSGNVTFAPGDSCNFVTYADGYVYDFNLSFIVDTLVV